VARDQNHNDKSALKFGPDHRCLQPHVKQLLFQKLWLDLVVCFIVMFMRLVVQCIWVE